MNQEKKEALDLLRDTKVTLELTLHEFHNLNQLLAAFVLAEDNEIRERAFFDILGEKLGDQVSRQCPYYTTVLPIVMAEPLEGEEIE